MRRLTLIVALASGAAASASENGTPLSQRLAVFGGYVGFKLEHPGGQLGLELSLARGGRFQVLTALVGQVHAQREVQTGIALSARFGTRYTASFGLMLESFIGLGVQQTFFTSRVYDTTVSPAAVKTVTNSGTGAVPVVLVGLGYDFGRLTPLPVTLYARPSVSWLFPDRNQVFATAVSFEVGLIWRLGGPMSHESEL